jgi:hypothetical protein
MIRHLAKNHFLNYRDLITELHLTPTRGDKARTWMINSGFVKVHSITLRRGKPGEYFELTEETYRRFGGTPTLGKGGFEHKCFCYKIKDFLEVNGFGVRLEGPMEGCRKPFDVLGWKKGEGMIGYEVTLTFHNLIENLRNGLRTTVKKIIVVCRNRDELQVAKSIVKKELGDVSRVEFNTIFEFTQKNKD